MNDSQRGRVALKVREAIVDAIVVEFALTGQKASRDELAAIAIGAAAKFVEALHVSPVSHLACCLVAHTGHAPLEAHRAIGHALEGAAELERGEIATGAALLEELDLNRGRA